MEKYILSDKKNALYTDLQEIKEFFLTEKLITNNRKNEGNFYPLGVNAFLLDIPRISLYDDSLVMKKYPHGVVTENFVLIPVEQFEKLKEKSIEKRIFENPTKIDTKVNMKNFALFLTEYMNTFTEVALNVELTIKDKEEINKQIKIEFSENNSIVPKPEKTTNRELLKFVEGKGYLIEEVIKNSMDLIPDIKEALKNNEKYIENIQTLKDKIHDVKITEVNDNINIQEFKDIMIAAQDGKVSPILPLKIVYKKIDKLLNESGDNTTFIENSDKTVLEFLVRLPESQYKLGIEYIYKNVLEGLKKSVEMDRERFLDKIVEQPLCTETKRSIAINVISGYDTCAQQVDLTSQSKKFGI